MSDHEPKNYLYEALNAFVKVTEYTVSLSVSRLGITV